MNLTTGSFTGNVSFLSNSLSITFDDTYSSLHLKGHWNLVCQCTSYKPPFTDYPDDDSFSESECKYSFFFTSTAMILISPFSETHRPTRDLQQSIHSPQPPQPRHLLHSPSTLPHTSQISLFHQVLRRRLLLSPTLLLEISQPRPTLPTSLHPAPDTLCHLRPTALPHSRQWEVKPSQRWTLTVSSNPVGSERPRHPVVAPKALLVRRVNPRPRPLLLVVHPRPRLLPRLVPRVSQRNPLTKLLLVSIIISSMTRVLRDALSV